MDIIWLQRDLGLYVVALFDTHYACNALGYSGRSLAYLLKRFVDFDADKKYQMADWRIRYVIPFLSSLISHYLTSRRPLPEEMLYYARSDTHYLLYIYDMVRNELVERSAGGDAQENLVEWVIQKSKEVSLQRYETPICDAETGQGSRGWFNSLAKSSALYSREQFSVYRAVYKWRDDMARQRDESPGYIMPQRVLAEIVRILPGDPKALWSVLPKDGQIVKSRLDELHAVIQDAKARGMNGPSMMEFFRGDSLGGVAKSVFGDLRAQRDKEAQIIPDAGELRSLRSQLWGAVPLSSVWDGSKSASVRAETSGISLPWTIYVQDRIAAGITATDAEQDDAGETEPVMLADNTKEAVVAEDEGFTLKGGRKRNIQDVDPGSESEPDSESESNPAAASSASGINKDGLEDTMADEKALSKAERKAAKRQRKKAAKEAMNAEKAELKAQKQARKAARKAAKAAASKQTVSDPSEEAEDEPFDYSKAQSVLHAQRANGRDQATPSRVFDPYAAKTGDAPKGARNMNYQKAGKTATFKK